MGYYRLSFVFCIELLYNIVGYSVLFFTKEVKRRGEETVLHFLGISGMTIRGWEHPARC